MPEPRLIAVLDVGKTNLKTVLVEGAGGREVWARTTPNAVLADGPYPHFDIPRAEAFFVDALADLVREHGGIDALSITAHGATGALIGPGGLALPVLDYEFAGPDTLAARYDAVRPPFAETCSPRLPGGLNVGAQLFWQAETFPAAFAAATFVTYAQYWSWWLTGVAATEPTSLGAHTDLWDPREKRFSSLVDRMGWGPRMAPLRSAFDVLGPVRPDLAARIGLTRPVPVTCGIHDSNASLLPHLQGVEGRLSVVSTGTWTILFAPGGPLDALDPARDTLANVDAYGRPVPSARFMGGREFDILTDRRPETPDGPCVAAVLERGVMALPTFVPGTGPFPQALGRWSHDAAALSPPERTAVASLYAALMTATCLDLIRGEGATVVEGPFARNALYCAALENLTGRPVRRSAASTGTSTGAMRLVVPEAGPAGDAVPLPAVPLPGDAFGRYAALWRDRVASGT